MAQVSGGASTTNSNYNPNANYGGPLAVITTLFFMWGFITSMNDILIPKLKAVFNLNYTEAIFIQFTFFAAYFIISLIYYIISVTKGDPILKIGYKNAIVIGLILSAIGSLMFYPAAETLQYPLFLGAFFVLASGVTILQIGANPYASLLGKPETASSRLNLTQAFNALGTTLAPIVGSYLIFRTVAEDVGADAVKGPYIGIAITLVVLAVLIKLFKLPAVGGDDDELVTDTNASIFRHKHLVLGMVGIFMYVGAEVTIGSFLVNFLAEDSIAGFTHDEASLYLSMYWGGAMVGRFFGSIFLADLTSKKRNLYLAVIGVLSLGYAYWVTNQELDLAIIFVGLVVLNLIAFYIGKNKANRTLAVFSGIIIIALLIAVFGTGHFAMWALITIGLYNSVMFPNIFTLAVKSLGKETSKASSLLVMAIVGGAIVPLIQGALADSVGVQVSYLLPIICYAYLMYYGIKGYEVKK
ncbi:MFS transporter, FHS family, L-fucose permease [Pustulibacterium marinum]|uniref:MFS transporter, FHS family, L-fucose permease n=1 Tax=Pustulibacterium marinum TaxID=1224947 RepID=A0A1I7FM86_9FLAO|nr:sugar MFS transporter [Pustulibacterium marinum]SFU37265.1 MFS transporter, FHS family, L-fucose permease [Pustulibacterium marinum]